MPDLVLDIGWCFFNDFLVSALDGAVTLVEMNVVAKLIAEDLDLDVPWLGDVLLDEDAVVGEGLEGLSLAGLKRLHEFVSVPDDSHALASSAGNCLDQHRILHLVGLLEEIIGILFLAVVARHNWNVGSRHDLLGFALAAHRGDGRRRRPDELYPILDALLRKPSILRQEAKSRMQGLAIGVLGDLQDLASIEVRLCRRVGADSIGLISHIYKLRVAVDIRVDGDGLNAESKWQGSHLLAVRMILQAISPRLATRIFFTKLIFIKIIIK